jgi:hypothetical protein
MLYRGFWMKIAIFLRAAALSAGVLAAGGITAAQALAPECEPFGKPSYTADRTVRIGGGTIRSKVIAAPGVVREEVALGGATQVRISRRNSRVSYDPDKKVGTRLPVRTGPRGAGKNLRRTVSDQGGAKVVLFEGRNPQGGWDFVSETRCRADGVMLSRRVMVPGQSGALVEANISQDNIRVGPVDRSQFNVPKDVKFGR